MINDRGDRSNGKHTPAVHENPWVHAVFHGPDYTAEGMHCPAEMGGATLTRASPFTAAEHASFRSDSRMRMRT